MIGEMIKRWRESAGKTQAQLGLSIGVSQKAISMYETGQRTPALSVVAAIAAECDIAEDSAEFQAARQEIVKIALARL